MIMSYSNYYASSQLFHGSLSSIMGTQLDVLLVGGNSLSSTIVWDEIEMEVKRLDKMLNRFDTESDISLINREAGHYPISVSDEIWSILQDCQHYYELTEGYFDVTVQDFTKVLLSEKDKSVFFFSETLHFDLGGYGKGYALSRIQQIVKRNGIGKALVNFGNSSVLAVGSHPHGAFWLVGIENPYTRERMADLKLCDSSLSISGNMPSHPQHILNPLTGQYINERKMVSIVARDPVIAEVLTTAFMVADDKRIPVIAGKFDIYEKHVYKL